MSDGEPAAALMQIAAQYQAELIVIGAITALVIGLAAGCARLGGTQ